MKVVPLNDKIVVKRLEADEKTAGGIVLPDSAKEKPRQGKVLSLGDGKFRPHVATQIPVGSLPGSTLRISVDQQSQFVLQFGCTPPGQRFHARPTDLARLVKGHE